MKKYLVILTILVSISYAEAQTELGLKISPLLSVNRATDDEESLNVSADGVGFRMSLGPIVDIYLKENYYVSTGLFYTPKRAGIVVNDAGISYKEEHKLQYLQLLALLKLYTNELALDKRLYFQL